MREQALKSLRLLPGWLLVSGLLLSAGLLCGLYPAFGWSLLAFSGIAGLGVTMGSPWLCCQLMILGLFTGILTALPIGFTLKAPQFFSLLGLLAMGLRVLYQRKWPEFPWRWAWPFGLYLLCILPSFLLVDKSELALGNPDTSLRLLLNYGLLQLFTLFLLLQATSLTQIVSLLKLSWLSCLASLVFGYGQQIGFYLGFYDPNAYIGQHSSIVDYYGPLLRLSPGTFANEYGEILQTVGILLAGWLLLVSPKQQRLRWLWALLLVLVIVGLVLNFTRASWLVFALGCLLLMLAARLRPSALIGSVLLGGLALALLLYLSQVLLEASVLLSIGQRFGELGQVQSHSAGQRLMTWQVAWEAFLASPWIGNGWGMYGETHNVPLQLLAETGLLGFTGFYALMSWCLWTIYRGWRAATDPDHRALLLTCGIAFMGCLGFDLTNHGIYHFVLWFTLGTSLALARLSLYPIGSARV